jgi:hypothetical protein
LVILTFIQNNDIIKKARLERNSSRPAEEQLVLQSSFSVFLEERGKHEAEIQYEESTMLRKIAPWVMLVLGPFMIFIATQFPSFEPVDYTLSLAGRIARTAGFGLAGLAITVLAICIIRYRLKMRKARQCFEASFGIDAPRNPRERALSQEYVDTHLARFARLYRDADQAQREASSETVRSQAMVQVLLERDRELAVRLEVAKRAFWDSYNPAKALGFRMKGKSYRDYLPEAAESTMATERFCRRAHAVASLTT